MANTLLEIYHCVKKSPNSNDNEIEDLYGDDNSNTNQGQNEPSTLQCGNQHRYPMTTS